MRSRTFLCALVLLAPLAPAHAQYLSAGALLERLHDDRRLMAMGFIAGAMDAGYKRVHCVPDNVDLGQVTNILDFYLTLAVNRHSAPAAEVVLSVAAANWPCPRTNAAGKYMQL